MAPPDPDVRRYLDNLQGEVDGAALYDALAAAEKDENVAGVYRRLAAVERAHAEFWRGQLRRKGVTGGGTGPSLRARSVHLGGRNQWVAYADGERQARLPLTIRAVPAAVSVVAP